MIESLDKSKKSLSYQIVVDKIPEPICEVFPDKNGNISIDYHNKYAYEYGIYLITHTSGKFYIGSSNSVSYRIFAHSKGIFKKSHSNKMINELCKNDSLDSFKFYIIDLPDFKVLGKIYNKDFDDITKDKYTRELEVAYITEYLKVFDKSLCCNSSLFVGNYARKAKIYKKNNTNDFTRKKFSNEQILDIIKMYNIEKKSLSEICIKYKCSNGPIKRVLLDKGITINSSSRKNKHKSPVNKINVTEEQEKLICELYSVRKYSPRRIQSKLKLPGAAITKTLRKYNLKRNWSEAASLRDDSDRDLRRKLLSKEQIERILLLFDNKYENKFTPAVISRKIAIDLNIGWRLSHRTLQEHGRIATETTAT